jgi:hypothetical protein
MLTRVAADAVVIIHLLFILFVMLGGLLVLRWRWLSLAHLPAVIWGAAVEFTGWLCPLTPLENSLRRASAQSGYSGGFIEHYIIPLIYPAGLSRDIQFFLGAIVVIVNLGVYVLVLRRFLKAR